MLLFGNVNPTTFIAIVIAVGLGMTIHEFAHNYVAYLMGDPVPAREGRLTLDPRVHINPIGFLMFVVVGFGILGSAPISPYRMRNQRWGYLAAVAAGPFSNLLLAIVFGIVFRILSFPPGLLGTILNHIVFWNVLLFVFNLLPLFPIDGWHIVLTLLPPELAYSWQRHAQTSQYVLLGLVMLSFARIPNLNLLGTLIYQPTLSIYIRILGF